MAFSLIGTRVPVDARGPGGGRQDLSRVLRPLAGDRRHGRSGGGLMVIAHRRSSGGREVDRGQGGRVAARGSPISTPARCTVRRARRARAPGASPAELARALRIELGDRVLLDGEDVTEAIRSPEVSERRVAGGGRAGGAGGDGRRAAAAAGRRRLGGRRPRHRHRGRARRRAQGLPDRRSGRAGAPPRCANLGSTHATVLAEQTIRDERDSTRAESPLRPAEARSSSTRPASRVEQVVRPDRRL